MSVQRCDSGGKYNVVVMLTSQSLLILSHEFLTLVADVPVIANPGEADLYARLAEKVWVFFLPHI